PPAHTPPAPRARPRAPPPARRRLGGLQRRPRGCGGSADRHSESWADLIASAASLAASSADFPLETSLTALATGWSPAIAPSRSPCPCGIAQRLRLSEPVVRASMTSWL